MLSIIIPTKNEEEYLPSLLLSIQKQGISDYEVIVADAQSTDHTRGIAESFGCRVVEGGNPAKGRNEGVKAASGELLLFADADIVLPSGFLKNALAELKERELDVASVRLDPGQAHTKLIIDLFYNYPVLAMEKVLPHGAMCIFATKDIFKAVGGFDTTISLAEDHYFTREAEKYGEFGILRSATVLISPRRFYTDGWVKTYLKYLACETYMVLKGPMRSKALSYRFDHYSQDRV